MHSYILKDTHYVIKIVLNINRYFQLTRSNTDFFSGNFDLSITIIEHKMSYL